MIKLLIAFFIFMGMGWAYDTGLGQSVKWDANLLLAFFGVASVAALRAKSDVS